MHGMITGIKDRLGLLAAIGALVAIIGLMPMFGSTAYATGLVLNNVVNRSEFLIPNGPITLTTAALTAVAQPPLTLNVGGAAAFPASGQILVGGSELMTYDSKTATSFNITQRNPQKNPPAPKKAAASGTLVQLATQTTAKLTGNPGHTTLESAVIIAAVPPFPISVADDTDFAATGFLTLSHSGTVVPATGSTEYFQYTGGGDNDNAGGGNPATDQLTLIARQLNANNVAANHPKDGFAQAGGVPGRSFVDQHEQLSVKSNVGFFPTGNLMIFNVDAGNNILDAELAGRILGDAATKIKTVPVNQMHITTRGNATATFQFTPIAQHKAGSVVISAATQLVCRAKNEQPGVDDDSVTPGVQEPAGQTPGTSVGTFSVCYTRSEPGAPPEPVTEGVLDQPIVGQALIVLNALNQPFLSTGGFNHILFGAVPHVDTNGTTTNPLNLISPCITNFTPGTNLQVNVETNPDKFFTTPDVGTIRVVLDTVHDAVPFNGDECDDPAGTAAITLASYIFTGDGDTSDDDTDGDGCTDDQELDNNVGTGGARDPNNGGDFFDANKDGSVTTVDIFAVAAKFGATAGSGSYSANHDRGSSYGPFGHNLSTADGAIAIPDIFAVAAQFGHAC